MKKIFVIFMMLSITSIFSPKCFAESAWDQLHQSAGDSGSAANSYSNGSYDYEGARNRSGYGYDTSSQSAPPVDLRGAGEHPTPQLFDRDAYVPKRYKSVKPSYVPPLP